MPAKNMKGVCSGKRVHYEKKIDATIFLQVLRRYHTLQFISEKTGIPVSLISRYATGKVLPNDKHLSSIERLYDQHDVIHPILKNYLDVSTRGASAYKLNTDPEMLIFVSFLIRMGLEENNVLPGSIDYVLVPESGGIPLGAFLSYRLCSKLIIAKRRRNILWPKYVTGLGGSHDSIREYYIPFDPEYRGARAIIIDDITIDGGTLESLYDIARKTELNVCCSYVVYALGSKWRERAPEVKPLIQLEI